MSNTIRREISLIARCFPALATILIVLVLPVQADLFNDGGVHNITNFAPGPSTIITVDNPPPPAPASTTVNFGGIGVHRMEAFNNGQVNINGGYIVEVFANDNSQMTMNGGGAGDVHANDNSQVTMNNGNADNFYIYNNSQVTINGGFFFENFYVYDNTQVTINDGHGIMYFFANDNCQVTMNGGGVYTLLAGGNTQLTVNSGASMSEHIVAFGNSQVTVNGGMIGGIMGGINAGENAQVTMNDGFSEEFWAYGNSQLTLNGGHIGHAHAFDNGQVTVKNGGIAGQPWYAFGASGNGLVTVYGSDFNVYSDNTLSNLLFSGYGILDSIYDGCYLTGTLAGGYDLPIRPLVIQDAGQIHLTPIPPAVLLGIFGLGVAGVKLRKYA